MLNSPSETIGFSLVKCWCCDSRKEILSKTLFLTWPDLQFKMVNLHLLWQPSASYSVQIWSHCCGSVQGWGDNQVTVGWRVTVCSSRLGVPPHAFFQTLTNTQQKCIILNLLLLTFKWTHFSSNMRQAKNIWLHWCSVSNSLHCKSSLIFEPWALVTLLPGLWLWCTWFVLEPGFYIQALEQQVLHRDPNL